MPIKELKKNPKYQFNCYYSKREIMKEVKHSGDYCDIWGIAELSIGHKGVDYNFYIEHDEDEVNNASAMYPCYFNEKEGYWETDYSNSIHYEIDFNKIKDLILDYKELYEFMS